MSNFFWRLCCMMLVALAFVAATRSEHSAVSTHSAILEGKYFKQAFNGPCPNGSCRIYDNPGGKEFVFMKAAEEVLGGYARRIVIDGDCYSACVLFADLARDKVCLTKNARMFVHKARATLSLEISTMRVDLVTYHDPHHSQDVLDLVHKKGGFPYDGLTELDSSTLSSIWQRCQEQSPTAAK